MSLKKHSLYNLNWSYFEYTVSGANRIDFPYLEPSREIEKSSSYRELEENSREYGKKQFLLHSEHFNHIEHAIYCFEK